MYPLICLRQKHPDEDHATILLEDATERMARTMALLKKERNLRTRLGRLPDEILSKIFEYHTENSALEPGYIDDQFGWRDIVSVCSRWRSVAMTTPKIWARINLAWATPLVEHCMRSSGTTPLRLLLQDNPPLTTEQIDAFGELMKSNRQRVIEIDIEWNVDSTLSRDFNNFLQSTMSDTYPMLRVLSLSSEVLLSEFPSVDFDSRNLETLTLRNFPPPPRQWSTCPRLKSLSLIGTVITPVENVEQIYDILNQHPLLETFCLECVPNSQSSQEYLPPDNYATQIAMPHLLTFTLHMPTLRGLRWLFEKLDLRSSTQLDLAIEDAHGLGDTTVTLPPILISRMRTAVSLTLDRADIDVLSMIVSSSAAASDKLAICKFQGDLSDFPFESLEELTVHGDIPSTDSTWSAMLEAWSNITSITLRNASLSDFFEAFVPDDSDEEADVETVETDSEEASSIQSLCSSLRVLDIRTCKYEPSELLNFLKQRHEEGVRLDVYGRPRVCSRLPPKWNLDSGPST
ncbi:hypothetical protein SISSUDRAFT_1064909 [Sistotremastrum suecicum HHB10207 ss-3]|uniref:F-box domain-containing protein n=1 Tax=Sistotremastrum suecicum HHB10207 ss-3 TaxID=1314776 RepID=A0A166A356_9AGAM|nr:hypothetical protein SISSUDRAFT_1064909 [Sistotremastrum suecicum HHB10207 ss-3]